MAATVTECGNVRIVTQVIQQKNPPVAEVISESDLTSMSSPLTSAQSKASTNTLPKALGVVLIVLGATQISFGIALTLAQHDLKTITVSSGVYFWIGIMLLVSGALLVEMEKRDHALLRKLCFFANLLVSVASVIAVILHATEMGQEASKEDPCAASPSEDYCHNTVKVLVHGLNSVFIILSLLELAVSVTAVVVTFMSTREQAYRQMLPR